ncbi:hypothetical protein DH2020_038395 [Rehmannia glutinosa]|uniref:Uncharacterized protein n=1 Tax=Rehmannia glutinosa TaxID=99300 RepID=A0ABR0V0K9_REHGL
MVALKQLSSESGSNYVRALQILEAMAKARSCLIMLDIEIDAMIVEMFQLFFNIIRSNHCSDVFQYMETIMTMIIEESDEVSLELLRPLLDSVRLDNKNISPISWELGKTVFDKCMTKLQPYLKEAVKALNLKVDEYAEIVAILCQDTPNGQNMVRPSTCLSGDGVSKLDRINEDVQEDCPPQVKDINGLDEIVQSERETGAHRRRRGRKPNSLMRAEEGYEHTWTRGGKESSISCHSNKTSKRSHVDYGKEMVDNGEGMVNLRLMIWWPLDKTFYTGTVEAFDPLTKKHTIKYDDDEEEVLDLREERWEPFDEKPRRVRFFDKYL